MQLVFMHMNCRPGLRFELAFVSRLNHSSFCMYLDILSSSCSPLCARYEYAISSSLMIVAIAVLFGCYDVASLLLIAVCNASMCLFGLM